MRKNDNVIIVMSQSKYNRAINHQQIMFTIVFVKGRCLAQVFSDFSTGIKAAYIILVCSRTSHVISSNVMDMMDIDLGVK